MKVVFFGNSKYSVIGAEKIHKKIPLSLVVTKPKSPVEDFANAKKIPCVFADKLDDSVIRQVAKYRPDFFVVEDYGLILPKKLLSVPKYAAMNIHHSLLPKYRGPTPAPSAILAGERETGVSIIKMAQRVDAGDILAQKKIKLREDETTDSLLTRLNSMGAEILPQTINKYIKRQLKLTEQDHSKATYTHWLTKESGFIDAQSPPSPQTLDRMIRAYYPWPGVWFTAELNNKKTRLKLLPKGLIQPEGKRPMPYKDFANGYKEGREILEKLHLLAF